MDSGHQNHMLERCKWVYLVTEEYVKGNINISWSNTVSLRSNMLNHLTELYKTSAVIVTTVIKVLNYVANSW